MESNGNGHAKGRSGSVPGSTKKVSDEGLTASQERFVNEFLLDQNAEQAALRAGFSKTVARRADSYFLAVPPVRAAIRKALDKVQAKTVIDAARVLQELTDVALADPRRLFDDWGNLKPITQWTAGEAACVASVDVVKRNLVSGDGQVDTILKIRMWDKPKTLEILARHLGMLTERIEIRGDAELVGRLASARRRVAVAIED